MAAPVGNQNAAKGKKWREAIMRSLARYKGSVDEGLDHLADKLVIMALVDGDKWAMDEIFNRLDGKPAQAIVGDEENPLVFREIVIRAIDATRDRPPEEG